MDAERIGIGHAVPEALEREVGLVRAAIGLVATGGSRRVVVAGLQLGDSLLATAERMAGDAGVRLVPLWTADESGLDIAVEAPE
jgi:hypothetical protein